MSITSRLLLWVVIGAAASAVHMILLHRAVNRLPTASPDAAQHRILRGFGIRIALLLPVLLLAARSGIFACLGWIIGWTMGRVPVCLRYLAPTGTVAGRGEQG